MSALSSVLRYAIQRSADPTPEARQRVYASARRGIERLLARSDMPEQRGSVSSQLGRLDEAIKEIEEEYAEHGSDIQVNEKPLDLATERRRRNRRPKPDPAP
uniref:hypothetical protein n=1 Tax=Neorhizobium sp. EC2-8 TaxID=3129230 RepID=UPI003100D8FE